MYYMITAQGFAKGFCVMHYLRLYKSLSGEFVDLGQIMIYNYTRGYWRSSY